MPKRVSPRKAFALSSCAVMAIMVASGARAAEAQGVEDAPASPAKKPTPPSTSEEIIVTGSRVITNGNNSPTPVTVVTTEALQAAHASTVFQAILDVPAFAGSRGGFSSAPSGNQAASSQISALSLRGLGAVRTLILFDGHRVPGSQLDGAVDANTIPEMLLQRVDVVTGGASAVYGSDAIGGVVNFITDRNFNGVKVDLQGAISEFGDAGQYRAGIAGGMDLFGGRGHIEASYQRLSNNGILRRVSRPQFNGYWTTQGNGCPNGLGSTGCVPYILVEGGRASLYTYGGKIINGGPLSNFTFNTDGVATRFVDGSTAGFPPGAVVQIGGDGAVERESTLIPQQHIDQVYLRFDYDVTDNINFYATGSFSRDYTYNNFGNVTSTGLVISATNAFLPLVYQQQLQLANVNTFTYNKKWLASQGVLPSSVSNTTKAIYATAGFEGRIGDDYKWEIGYSRSNVDLHTQGKFTMDQGKLFAALDAVVNPANGAIVCRVTLTNPGLYPGCVPINVFGPSAASAEAVAYVRRIGDFRTYITMDDVNGSITGKPFSTWAGPVGLALSAEWRRQSLEVRSTNPTIDYAPLNCTGLVFNCTNPSATSLGTASYNGGVAPRPPVYQTVAEASVEANIPLLAGSAIAQSLNLNLAFRHARYTAQGNPVLNAAPLSRAFKANTWKVGVDWHLNDILSVRATRSQDIRAPNLNELFQTTGVTFSSSTTDTLTGSTLTPTGTLPGTRSGGNPNLTPERAATYTVGLVARPFPGLSIAVDYYSITIRDYITILDGSAPLIQAGCYAGNAEFCALQVRPGPITDTSRSNSVISYLRVPVNAAELKTHGIDFEVNYSDELFARPFSIRLLASYQPHVYLSAPGQNKTDQAGVSFGKWRATAYLRYALSEKLDLNWRTTFRSRLHYSADPTLYANPNTETAAVSYSNLTASYKFGVPSDGQATVYFGIENIFDQKAPVASTQVASPGLTGGSAPGDDPTGRYYRLGVRIKW